MTGERSLHVSVADSAPGLLELVSDMATAFGASNIVDPRPVIMDDWNADWDVLYPFSQVCDPDLEIGGLMASLITSIGQKQDAESWW